MLPVRVQRRWRGVRALGRAALLCGMLGLAVAQAATDFSIGPSDRTVGPPERTVAEWLVRLQRAARIPAYTGTFVVSSASGAMASSRIWHASEGDAQIERVDALSGTPRTTFRRNDSVVTFWPETRSVRVERRDTRGMFPNLLATGSDFSTAQHYGVRQVGQGRVAGFEADIVLLVPRDELRFGYRIWSEQTTGLPVKMQTLDVAGHVLEQAAFSELQFDVPVTAHRLEQMMLGTNGYRVVQSERVRTTAAAEGWELKSPVAGFLAQACYRLPATGTTPLVQCIFSDGLAAVSLFMEPLDRPRQTRELALSSGATHTLTRRITDKTGDWWLTVVGEVPVTTLKAFVDGVERKR